MAGLHFDITGDNSNFMRKLEETRNGVINTSKRIEESGMSIEQMFGRMTKAAAAFGAGFSAQQFASQVMKVRGEFQQLEVAFNTMLGSKEKADTLMSQLVRTAAITPFDLQGVANGAKQLLAYGTAAEDVNSTLVRLGDIAAGLSIPLNDLVWLYGTTMTQGRLFTQDLRQFQGRGIPLADELAKQFGVTKDKVGELVTAGKVGFPEVQKAIEAMTNEGGKFGGLMEAQSKTITGQISNIEDAISTMFNEIGKSNEGVINSALSGVSYLVEHWEDVAIAIESAAIAYGTYKAAVMTTAALQGAEQTLKIDTEIEGLKSLLVVKEESKNADIAAAVASGRLTEAKAMELAALREELATRLTVLKLKEEEAITEHASALSAFNTAKQASDAANERLEKMDALYQAALAQGDASYEQYAMEQLQTASANANTAATTLNTAEKNLNAASSKRKATSEAVDTMATQANTVANHVNTASMNIMKLAAIQLTTILKGMWATLMANPLLLVAGAVIGLGFAIYKLATAETEAEKATRMYNEALDEQQKKQDEYKGKIDSLIKAIDDNNKSEGERLQAFEALKAEYPTVLNNLLTEAEYLKDVLKYKKLIAEEDNNRAKQSDEEMLEEAKAKLKHYEWLKKQGVNWVDTDGNGLSTDDVNKAIMEQQKIVNKQKAKVASHDVTSFLGNIKDLKDSDIASVIDGINTSLKALGKSGDDAIAIVTELGGEFSKSQLSTIKSALETEQNARNTEKNTGKEWVEKYKKSYLDAKDELDKFLNSENELSEIEYERKLKELTDKKDEAEKKYKASGGKVTTDKQVQSEADKLRKEQEKYKLLVSKQGLERIRQQQDLENQVSRSKIDAMENGFEKEQAQRELNNKLEIQSIQRQKEDYIQAAIKAQKDLFDVQEELKAKQNKGYIKKSFDPSSVSVDTSAFDTIISNTSKRQQNDKVRSQEEAWNEYLLKFGNYQQKRQAIIEKYDKQIKEAGPAGDAAILEKNKQNTLDELDNSVMNSTTLMGQLFADASQKSVGEIQKIIDRAELLIDYLAGAKDEEGNITIGGVAYNDASIAKTVGISGNTLQNLQSSPEEVEALTNAIRNLKSELGAKSPFKLFETQIEDAVKKIKSGGKDSMAQGIADIGNAIVSFSPAIKQFGSDLASIFGEELSGDIANVIDGVSGLGQTAAGIGQIMSGDIVGGVMGVVGGISQVVNAMGSLFGPDGTAYYEGIKEQLEAINSVYDKIIDKSKEDIVFGGGFSSIEAASTALDNYEKKLLNLQKIADASGRAGASWKSHSAEWHSNKNVGAGDFGQMSRILGKSIKTMDDLYYLTGEELYLVMSQMPEAWSRIDGRIRENLESIVACKDEANELKDALNEAMTGIDQDSFYNGFIDQLSDMDTSFEDMCDNFEGYLRKSIIAGLIASQYKTRIDGLYEQWSEAAKSDKEITEDESDILRQKYKEIIEDMMKDREQMAKDFGWDSSSSSQSATSKSFQTMSQDIGNELNGRFTALQISNEEIKNSMLSMLVYVNLISVSVNNNSITLMEIKNLMVTSNGYLEDISGHTKKMLADFGAKLDSINKNIEKAI